MLKNNFDYKAKDISHDGSSDSTAEHAGRSVSKDFGTVTDWEARGEYPARMVLSLVPD